MFYFPQDKNREGEWKNIRNWGFPSIEDAERRIFRDQGWRKHIIADGIIRYTNPKGDERWGTHEMRLMKYQYVEDSEGKKIYSYPLEEIYVKKETNGWIFKNSL